MDWFSRYEKTLAVIGIGVIVFCGVWAIQKGYIANLLPAAALLSRGEKPTVTPPALSQYIEVKDSCDWEYKGTCVAMRSGPGVQYPAVLQLRTGMILKVAGVVSENGREWYKIDPGENIRYAERIKNDWYVAKDVAVSFFDIGDESLPEGITVSTPKKIIVSRSKEMLYAYDGNTLFMEEPISTGLELTPTPRGTFTVYKKTPTRYMQGPLPGISEQYYDLPGVPWNLYFTLQGGVIHGAYWHNRFGEPWSHGCVNLPPDQAKKLYEWAEVGTPVVVED